MKCKQDKPHGSERGVYVDDLKRCGMEEGECIAITLMHSTNRMPDYTCSRDQ